VFGGWTKNYLPPGVFPSTVKQEYYKEVDHGLARDGLFIFFHNNPWCQGPSVGYPIRYDLAGQGTSGDPGIHWYFDYVADKLGITGQQPPTVRTQPSDQIVTEGQKATFTVSVSGTAPLTYQWQKDGAGITGANGSTYQTPVTSLADNGAKYKCTITNSFGSITTRAAVLTVREQGTPAEAIIEAEDMSLDGYVVDTGTKLNGTGIKVDHTAVTSGSAITYFDGVNGTYTITVVAIPEDDGQPTVALYINNSKVLEKTYPIDPSYADHQTRVNFTVSGITLNQGDQIKIIGTLDASANARLDKIILTPETTGTGLPVRSHIAALRNRITVGQAGNVYSLHGSRVTGIKACNRTGLYFYLDRDHKLQKNRHIR
jgi:hypothetical protein